MMLRARLYIAWMLGEIVCIAGHLGAYPTVGKNLPGNGPKNFHDLDNLKNDDSTVTYDFDTVKNMDFYMVELSSTMRDGIRGWNMTVQFWLATNVYRRFPIGGNHFKLVMSTCFHKEIELLNRS